MSVVYGDVGIYYQDNIESITPQGVVRTQPTRTRADHKPATASASSSSAAATKSLYFLCFRTNARTLSLQ